MLESRQPAPSEHATDNDHDDADQEGRLPPAQAGNSQQDDHSGNDRQEPGVRDQRAGGNHCHVFAGVGDPVRHLSRGKTNLLPDEDAHVASEISEELAQGAFVSAGLHYGTAINGSAAEAADVNAGWVPYAFG